MAIAASVLALLLSATPGRGEIFKCPGRKAMPTYQNFPCEFDSLGAMPAPNSGPASPVPAVSRTAGARTPAGATAPRVGMTAKEVRAIWGEPMETMKEEYVKGDIETWRYPGSRAIRFDPKGRVQHISW